MTRSMLWIMAMHALRVVLAIAGIVICLDCLAGCISTRPASYEADLVICNQRATTLRESIDCENDVRARYGRPPRPVLDGGAP